MRIAALLLVAALTITANAQEPDEHTVTEREGQPLVTYHRGSDPEMVAATGKARASLKQFEQLLAHPPATLTRISLKGRFEVGEHVEHMWIDEVVVTKTGYRGVLANDPLDIESLHLGDVVTVPRDHVSDWFAVDDGKLVGGYTLRLQRARLPADKRAVFDASVDFVIED